VSKASIIVDDLTVTVMGFSDAKPHSLRVSPSSYGPAVSQTNPEITCRAAAVQGMFWGPRTRNVTGSELLTPIGTGPSASRISGSNDVIQMESQPQYRDPNKPAFATLTLKGVVGASECGGPCLVDGKPANTTYASDADSRAPRPYSRLI